MKKPSTPALIFIVSMSVIAVLFAGTTYLAYYTSPTPSPTSAPILTKTPTPTAAITPVSKPIRPARIIPNTQTLTLKSSPTKTLQDTTSPVPTATESPSDTPEPTNTSIPPTNSPAPEITPTPIPTETPQIFHVMYQIVGSAYSANITMLNDTGGTEQRARQPVPFTYEFDVPSGALVYLSAQNNDATGQIACIITVNGNVYKNSLSIGAYVIVTCSGTVK